MLFIINVFLSHSCIGTVPVTVKKPQTDAGTEGVTDGSVNIGLRYHPFFQRLPGRCHNHFLIIGKAVHSCLQSISHCFRVALEIFMVIYGLLHIPAVTDHMAGQPPGVLQYSLNFIVNDGRHAVDFIIGGHDCLCTAFCYGLAEGLQIILVFISPIQGGGYGYSVVLHIICIKMLQGCTASEVKGIISLHSPDIS